MKCYYASIQPGDVLVPSGYLSYPRDTSSTCSVPTTLMSYETRARDHDYDRIPNLLNHLCIASNILENGLPKI